MLYKWNNNQFLIFCFCFCLFILLVILLNINQSSKEPFVQHHFRPYIRNARLHCEHFANEYGPDVINKNIKKWLNY